MTDSEAPASRYCVRSRPAQPPRSEGEGFAWVIERGSSKPSHPEYFYGFTSLKPTVIGTGGSECWGSNHELALRFARKTDAERLGIHYDLGGKPFHRICEHGWMSAPQPPSPAVGMDRALLFWCALRDALDMDRSQSTYGWHDLVDASQVAFAAIGKMTGTFEQRTDREELNALIEKARARGPMTEAELAEQRASWVRGEMGMPETSRIATPSPSVGTGETETKVPQ